MKRYEVSSRREYWEKPCPKCRRKIEKFNWQSQASARHAHYVNQHKYDYAKEGEVEQSYNPFPLAAIGEVVGTGLGTGVGFATGFTLVGRAINNLLGTPTSGSGKRRNPIRGRVEVSHIKANATEVVNQLRGAGYEFLTNYDTTEQALSRAKVLERDGYDVKITPVILTWAKDPAKSRPWWVFTRRSALYRSNPR